MPSSQAISRVQPVPAPLPAACPAAKPAPAQAEASSQIACDSTAFKTLKQGSTTASVAGTLVTLPNEIVKTSDTVAHVAQLLHARAAVTAGSRAGIVVAKVAAVSSRALQGSQVLAKAANVVMNAPLIGKLTRSQTAEKFNGTVMPVINAAASGLGIYENSVKYRQASAQGNTAAQVLSGVQIGLNAVSGTAGFFKGRGQAISAVAGFSSLLLDGFSYVSGIGRLPKAVSPKP